MRNRYNLSSLNQLKMFFMEVKNCYIDIFIWFNLICIGNNIESDEIVNQQDSLERDDLE